MTDTRLVGLMSGTSVDAIDAALASFSDTGMRLLHTLEYPLPDALKRAIEELSQPGDNEIERLGRLDRELGEHFAQAANALLSDCGAAPAEVAGIGCHGQTIRHHPPSSGAAGTAAFTLQIGDPNTIAELTGITTVADFRRRDVAAGGEGAPLAPAFHRALMGRDPRRAAVVNIGGIANISLFSDETTLGFDTGPGNTLMDHWIAREQGQPIDVDGAWAAGGKVDDTLLQALRQHPFLSQSPPRSTGKEAFNLGWLDAQLASLSSMSSRDVQATLAEYTAVTIADAVPGNVRTLYICGGGAANGHLMARLAARLPGVRVTVTTELGCAPDWVEAMAFAWLAWRTLSGLSGNLPDVTGATGPRILGGIYHATTREPAPQLRT